MNIQPLRLDQRNHINLSARLNAANSTHGSEWMVQVLATNSAPKKFCALASGVELYRSRSFGARRVYLRCDCRKDLNASTDCHRWYCWSKS